MFSMKIGKTSYRNDKKRQKPKKSNYFLEKPLSNPKKRDIVYTLRKNVGAGVRGQNVLRMCNARTYDCFPLWRGDHWSLALGFFYHR